MERPLTFLLSFVTGFADTVGYIALSGLFIAQITGNLVLVGAGIYSGEDANAVNRLLMIPVFMLGAGAASRLSARLPKAPDASFPVLLAVESVLLLLFAGLGHFLQTQHHPLSHLDMFAIAAAGVSAMAVQNASVRQYFPGYVSTTVMTTNLTQFAVDLAGCLARAVRRKKRSPEDEGLQQQRAGRLHRYGAALAGFIAGTAAGALLYRGAGLAAGTVPALLVLVLADLARYSSLLVLFPFTHRNEP
ncbi:MAG: DUF1275 domain-containing protein [Cytophagales bacterium]|nr:DUF1275 domain-containing protein [Cytophagales bacterium]